MKNLLFLLFTFLQVATLQTIFKQRLVQATISLTNDKVTYDPSYFSIKYPNGDVPKGKGVCTDVVIRAYRKVGVDLQKEVHIDMKKHFNLYPKIRGLIPNTFIE